MTQKLKSKNYSFFGMDLKINLQVPACEVWFVDPVKNQQVAIITNLALNYLEINNENK